MDVFFAWLQSSPQKFTTDVSLQIIVTIMVSLLLGGLSFAKRGAILGALRLRGFVEQLRRSKAEGRFVIALCRIDNDDGQAIRNSIISRLETEFRAYGATGKDQRFDIVETPLMLAGSDAKGHRRMVEAVTAMLARSGADMAIWGRRVDGRVGTLYLMGAGQTIGHPREFDFSADLSRSDFDNALGAAIALILSRQVDTVLSAPMNAPLDQLRMVVAKVDGLLANDAPILDAFRAELKALDDKLSLALAQRFEDLDDINRGEQRLRQHRTSLVLHGTAWLEASVELADLLFLRAPFDATRQELAQLETEIATAQVLASLSDGALNARLVYARCKLWGRITSMDSAEARLKSQSDCAALYLSLLNVGLPTARIRMVQLFLYGTSMVRGVLSDQPIRGAQLRQHISEMAMDLPEPDRADFVLEVVHHATTIGHEDLDVELLQDAVALLDTWVGAVPERLRMIERGTRIYTLQILCNALHSLKRHEERDVIVLAVDNLLTAARPDIELALRSQRRIDLKLLKLVRFALCYNGRPVRMGTELPLAVAERALFLAETVFLTDQEHASSELIVTLNNIANTAELASVAERALAQGKRHIARYDLENEFHANYIFAYAAYQVARLTPADDSQRASREAFAAAALRRIVAEIAPPHLNASHAADALVADFLNAFPRFSEQLSVPRASQRASETAPFATIVEFSSPIAVVPAGGTEYGHAGEVPVQVNPQRP